MRTRLNLVRFFCCVLLVAVIGTANSLTESIARPTRPKMTNNLEVLKLHYFDGTNNFGMNGRGRFGKRRDVAPRMSELNAAWETLKMILNAQIQEQQRQERLRQSKEQEYGNLFHSSDGDEQHVSRMSARPNYPLNVVDKYYYDVQ